VRIHPRNLTLQDLVSSFSQEQLAWLKHVTECARCRQRLEDVLSHQTGSLNERLAEVLPWPGGAEADYNQAIKAAENRFLLHARSLATERAEAASRFAELMEQPSERWEILLRNHRRFQTWGLLEWLLEHCREQFFVDPLSAESFARLSLALSDLLDAGYYGADRIEDLRARAWGFIGNARRIRFEFQAAEEAFETAYLHLRKGTGDVLERALLFELQGNLLRSQRRFSKAERLLLRALRIYREVGETHRAGRALVSITTIYEQAGTPELSIPLLREALELIDAEGEPRLVWTIHHNLITVLAEAGRFMEAQGLFIQARPLYARFTDGQTQNRRRWVAGKIARGLGQAQEAEAHLQAAREGFIADGLTYDAALVSLDLAALYADRGRVTELKQVAEEMLAIFSSRQIHREALAALSFLQEAALTERANLQVVTGVATFLKRLQSDPELSFIQPAVS
jgi:tetratricopeptide (TPR) repeat protein